MPTFIDLFAGCGGMSLGFTRAGYTILGGIENNADAVRTHAINFFPNDLEHNSIALDITRLTPEQFMHKILKAESPGGLVDVIIGGPPCQAFARIGRAKLREIMQHPDAFLLDKRAGLYTEYLEYVEYFQPRAVVMENVPDIMNFGGTNVAEEVALSLDEIGYTSRYTILNSAYYGVPQMRQRFFLIAIKKELNVEVKFPDCTNYIKLPDGYENAQMVALGNLALPRLFENQSHFIGIIKPSTNLPPAITAEQALVDLPIIDVSSLKRGARSFTKLEKYRTDIVPSAFASLMRKWPGFQSDEGVYDHVTRSLPRDYKIFRRMEHGNQYPEAYALALRMFEEAKRAYEERTGEELVKNSNAYKKLFADYVPPYDPGKFPNKWRKMEPDLPARTLTAHIGKDTYSHIHYDSTQGRVISVREAARLQSFPDGFKFSGAMNAAFKQIGNAVPPLLAYAVAEKLRKLLDHASESV
jgi:DNA (cytosine-5)-methyltransferase 1